MGMIDDMLGEIAGTDMATLAEKVGLTVPQVESGLAAMGRARAEPGDVAGLGAAKAGLPVAKMQALLAAIGGVGALDRLIPVLGQEGELGGMATGVFER